MYKLRKIETAEDIAAAGRIRSVSWKETCTGLVCEKALNVRSPEYCAARLSFLKDDSDASGVIAIETESAEAVGFVVYATCGESGEICALYTLEKTHGSGLGAALLKAAEGELANAGCRGLFLWVIDGNGRARTFYEKHGYADTGKREVLPELGEGVVAVEMSKIL